jgi:NADPH2:quinone reductase
MPADRLVKLPDAIDDITAAATMLKGLTAQYLLFRTFQVKPRQTILFHAAAGGVGLIAGQWASHLGATLIGTVSTPEKAKLAQENGYHHVINYKEENFVERVKEITRGEGVDVVYDSVGKTTYPHSLHCLKRLGMWVCFGQSSGVIENFDLRQLAQNGSLFATRPSLFNYIYTKEELEEAAQHLFEALENGVIKVSVNQQFSLKDARKAHEMLESRKTTGSTVLLP